MREQCSQLARLRVFLPSHRTGERTHQAPRSVSGAHSAHRSVSGRTRVSNPSEVLRQGELPGCEGVSQGGPQGKAVCPTDTLVPPTVLQSVSVSRVHRKEGNGWYPPLLPFLQAGEVFWRMTPPFPCWRPLHWFYFDIKSKSGIYPSRGIVISF